DVAARDHEAQLGVIPCGQLDVVYDRGDLVAQVDEVDGVRIVVVDQVHGPAGPVQVDFRDRDDRRMEITRRVRQQQREAVAGRVRAGIEVGAGRAVRACRCAEYQHGGRRQSGQVA